MPRRKTSTPSKASRSKRAVDAPFLRAFGEHCRRLRTQLGYSVDRLSRESENLSSSVIQRLETGSGPVNLSSLRRYSQVLGVSLADLFSFESQFEADNESFVLPLLSPREVKNFEGPRVAVYSAAAAAGHFGRGEAVEVQGWAALAVTGFGRLEDLFVVQVRGQSMQPLIRDKDFLLMRRGVTGSRQGKVVLAQYVGPADPDFGGSYTVKVYDSKKSVAVDGETWVHSEITLKPINTNFEPIVFREEDIEGVSIIGECLGIVRPDLSIRRV